jgi:hypothetical protein
MEIIVPWNWWVTQRGGRVHVCWDQECVPAISYTYKQGVLCILGEPNIEFRLEAQRFDAQRFQRSYGFVVEFIAGALRRHADSS